MKRIGIIDYGMGNLQSVRNAVEFLGAEVRVLRHSGEMDSVSHVILPGVGSFAEGMRHLKSQGLVEAIRKLKGIKPFLGICLGMQLLAEQGVEGGGSPGLGLIPGSVPRLRESGLRVPHVGWNDIRLCVPNALLRKGMEADYYFVHSYCFQASRASDVLAVCDYDETFPCMVGRDAEKMYGVQFHPEKSHRFGLEILKNFLAIPC